MFLEKLEIFGFKAIPYKLKVKFGPGVTAIIGPNGCGKSNLSDAIRWVLGEQSVRQLRGHSMEDVIFNGTANRKPLGLAEVYLTFSNTKNLVPLDYDTVTVGRRLFRSGQSDYLINKTACRLRDVKDILLDTGIGSSGYSLIAREMVESVLSDDSGQRRQMLEEAAGISKYKQRKREALNKLRATESDLVRVADIVSEVEREVRSLGRQVGKARRYRRYLERIRQLDLALSRLRVHGLAARRDELEGSLASGHADVETRRARVGELELELETQRLADVEIERALSAAQGALDTLDRRLTEWDSETKVLRERRTATEQRIEEAQNEVARLETRGLLNAEQLAQLEADLDAFLRVEAEEAATLDQRETVLKNAEREWRERREELANRKQLRLDLVEDHVERRAAYAQMTRRREELGERLAGVVAERSRAQEEFDARQEGLDRSRTELGSMQTQSVETTAALHQSEEHVAELETQVQDLSDHAAAYAERVAAHESRLEVLFDLKRRYEGYTRGVQTLLGGDKRPDGLHGTVSEIMRVPADLVEAMEAVLGNATGFIVTEARGGAGQHIDRLRSSQGGRATFLPLENLDGNGRHSGNGGSPEGLGILGLANRLVEPQAERFQPVLDFLLADVVVVEDREQALEVVARPEVAGYRVVTRDGEIWSQGGTVAGGATGGSSAATPLGREQEITAVGEALDAVRAEMEQIADRREESGQELAAAQSARAELARQCEHERETLFELEKAVQAAELATHAQSESLADLTRTATTLEREIQTLATEAAALEQALASARTRTDDFEAGYAELEDVVGRLEAERESKRQEEQDSRLKWTANATRLSETRGRIERRQQERDEIVADLERRGQEIVDGHLQVEELVTSIAGLEAQVKEGLVEREGKETAVREVETRYAEARAATAEIEEQTRQVRRGLDKLVDETHQREIELERARAEIEATSARIREEYEVELLETDEILDEGQGEEEAIEELGGLRESMRTLGPVNLLAIEQHDEVKERFQFLTRQRDDLVKAREELLEAIERINRAASELFHTTFDTVRENFQDVFTTLFEGGQAELRLVGDELDGAIEIMARPRGKNLRSVSLMSGGERALTAISLLFAIYLAKPSPFCIMDEVDAPLDDANIERFVNLLRRFSQDTQFIVITHNKNTMEAAERLYGVTMEEPGVSKLVSVRLDHGEIRATDGEQTDMGAEAGNGGGGAGSGDGGAGHGDDPASMESVGLDAASIQAELDAEALQTVAVGVDEPPAGELVSATVTAVEAES